MIRVIEEDGKRSFEAQCEKAVDDGFKLSSSSCGYVPAPYDCSYFMAIFYKDEALKQSTEKDELVDVLEDILHSAFEHGGKNLSGKTLDPDGEMLWKAKQLVNKIRNK